MPIKIRCPAGHMLALPDRYAGRTVRCPACGSHVVVPGGALPGSREELADMVAVFEANVARGPAAMVDSVALPCESVTDRLKRQMKVTYEGPRFVTRVLAGFLLAMSLLTVVPVGAVIGRSDDWGDALHLPVWCHLLLVLAVVHASHAILLLLLPDWSSLWGVTHLALVTAASYGMGTALGLFGRADNRLLMQLELLDGRLSGGLTKWCLIQVSLWTVMTYAMGHTALGWRKLQRAATRIGRGCP